MKKLSIRKKYLNIAWKAGIVELIFLIPFYILDYLKFINLLSSGQMTLFYVMYIVLVISVILVANGFIVLGKKLQNTLIVNFSYAIIALNIINAVALIISNFTSYGNVLLFLLILILLYISGILVGIGIYQIKNTFGRIASVCGIIIIINNVLLLLALFILAFRIFDFVPVVIPALILEIFILYKASNTKEF
jgi:ABC-type glycerol-3-phosphate transport system permease component